MFPLRTSFSQYGSVADIPYWEVGFPPVVVLSLIEILPCRKNASAFVALGSRVSRIINPARGELFPWDVMTLATIVPSPDKDW